jgi:hypothetical protein
MLLKTRYIQEINGGGGVVFATGTPIANSVAEMFTMQRYLQTGTLRKQQLQHFDSWAATFGEPVTAMELAPDGAGYRLNTRFARFINVPELMQIFCQVADIQTADKLKLPVPEMQTGKPMIVRAPATPQLKALVAMLVVRADAIRSGRVHPSEDNMLKITSEGRKAALDLRVLDPEYKDQPQSKINLAADKIFQIWQDTRENRCAQMVFCDLSTPSKLRRQFCAYDDLKAKLVQRGIPAEEIAFMQDYDNHLATVGMSTPDSMQRVANKWRKSWCVRWCNPNFLQQLSSERLNLRTLRTGLLRNSCSPRSAFRRSRSFRISGIIGTRRISQFFVPVIKSPRIVISFFRKLQSRP